MCDRRQASQPERPLRHRQVFGRYPWRRRTSQDRSVTAGAIQLHTLGFKYLIDPQYLGCQPLLNASSGVAMAEGTIPVLPGWPWGSMRQRNNLRLLRPVGPQRAEGGLLSSFVKGPASRGPPTKEAKEGSRARRRADTPIPFRTRSKASAVATSGRSPRATTAARARGWPMDPGCSAPVVRTSRGPSDGDDHGNHPQGDGDVMRRGGTTSGAVVT